MTPGPLPEAARHGQGPPSRGVRAPSPQAHGGRDHGNQNRLALHPMTAQVQGVPRRLLRAEGAAVLIAAVAAFAHTGLPWWMFAALFLIPDLAIIAYLGGNRAGSACYNATHVYIGPILTLGAGLILDQPTAAGAGLIWAAHIGFDRALGLGLKYASGFGHTHLGWSGERVRHPVSEQ